MSETLCSMKLPAEPQGAEKMYPTMAREEYPYGLRINLENAQLDALGFPALPQVGAELTIAAKGKVVSTSQYETDGPDGRKQRTVTIQITDLAFPTTAG